MNKIPEPEPRNLTEAIEFVRGYHEFTCTTLDTYRRQDPYGVRGGYGGLYILIHQGDYFTGLLTPELVEEGKRFTGRHGALIRSSFRKAIDQSSWCKFIDISENDDPVKALRGKGTYVQDEITREAEHLMLRDPEALRYFEEMVAYEEKLLSYLESLL